MPSGTPKIRAVYFDFDGVLTPTRTTSEVTFGFLYQHIGGKGSTGLTFPEFLAKYAPFIGASERGQIRDTDMLHQFSREVGVYIDPVLLVPAYRSTPKDMRMMDLARKIRSAGQVEVVGIITDNPWERIAALQDDFEIGKGKLFHPTIVSADFGVRTLKADPEAVNYDRAEQYSGIPKRNSLFIDNSRRNVEAAIKKGMRSVHFDDKERDLIALEMVLSEEYGLRL